MIPGPRFCECCAGPVLPAPVLIYNRPGLAEIAYRLGRFGSFRQAMLQQIHTYAELTGFLTRESDDHAVTFIELAAALGDVLAFYNERLANEMYLVQARHKASLQDLVALVGYVPRPALSALGSLDFEIAEGPATRIWQGLKVMSVPGPDETAVVFETLEEIRATARLNAAPLFAAPQPLNPLAENSRRAPILGATGIAPGDRLMMFGTGATTGPTTALTEEKRVTGITEAPGGTYLGWEPPMKARGASPDLMRAAQALRKLRFFGFDAPAEVPHFITVTEDATLDPQSRWATRTIDASLPADTDRYPLSSKLDDLEVGAHLLLDAGPGARPRLQTARVTAVSEAQAALRATGGESLPPNLTETVTHMEVRQTIRGRPTAASFPGFSFAAFARNGGGHPGWVQDVSSPQSLRPIPFDDARAASDLATAFVNPSFHLYMRDGDGALSKAVWFGAWFGWQSQGGQITSMPAPLVLPGGQVRVFVRGADLQLLMYDTSGAVLPPEDLGGALASSPAPVAFGAGAIAVFARGMDDALWMRVFDGASWQDWDSLGGRIAGTPSAVSSGAGDVDVFARSLDGGLLNYRRTSSGWQKIRELGGDVAGDPSAVDPGFGIVAAGVRTSDDRLALIWRSGETWNDWRDEGGPIASDPSLVGAFFIMAAARHPDGTLVTRFPFATMPWSQHGDGFSAIPDVRAATLAEIGEELRFRRFDYPAKAAGGRLVLPLRDGERADDPDGFGPLDKGRKLMITGPDGLQHRTELLDRRAVSAIPGGVRDHLEVTLSPGLPATKGALALHGNLAEASHGETQNEEAIGSGDATRAFQSFRAPPGEITHLPVATSTRPQPQAELRVDGLLWDEVPSLFGQGPKARVHTLALPAEDSPVVRGGNGLDAGARFPTGPVNLRLTRRLGAGPSGNLRAGQLSIALEKPIGLNAVTNPAPTGGGAEAEPPDGLRGSAPSRVRTFGRIVSLADFATLATASGLAAKAHVTWVWRRMQRSVHLTVAGPDGLPLSTASLKLLRDQLTASRDPNRPLSIANMVRVPIVVSAKLMRDPARRREDVAEAARRTLEAAFGFAARDIGQPVHLSDIYAILQAAEGVHAVDIDLLQVRDHADFSAAERAVRAITAQPVQPHIRLFEARPTPANPVQIDRYQTDAYLPDPAPAVLPAEQAWFATPARDIALTVVEAL